MARITHLIIVLATCASYVGTSSNSTLQLPITINPLLQDSIQRGSFTNGLIQFHPNFFEYVTFSDIVKELGYDSLVPQLVKHLKSLVILGLAAQENGLNISSFEFVNTSKWTIIMTVEELANASNNITVPIHDEIPLIVIQEAMFTILERKFNFKTEEVAETFNTTIDQVYAFLEPGWMNVVHFITKKNILKLSRNYSIPPFYIAQALNMTLSELYSSTLPQLEDILTNQINVIKEAAESLKRFSSTVVSPTVISSFSFKSSSAVHTAAEFAGEKSMTREMTMTSRNSMSLYQQMTSTLRFMSERSTTNIQRSSSILANSYLPSVDMAMNSSIEIESTTVSNVQTKKQSVDSMHNTVLLTTKATQRKSRVMTSEVGRNESSITTIQATQSESSAMARQVTYSSLILEKNMSSQFSSNQVPTTPQQMSKFQAVNKTERKMLQQMTAQKVTPTNSTIPKISTTSSKSHKVVEMNSMTSTASPNLSQRLSSKMTEISSTLNIILTEITPTTTAQFKSSYNIGTIDISTSQDLRTNSHITAHMPSLNTQLSSNIKETMNDEAMRSSSTLTITTSIITTSFVMKTPSYNKMSAETTKLRSNGLKTTRRVAESTKRSKFLRNSQSFSSYHSRASPASKRLPTYSTNSKIHVQSSSSLQSPLGFKSTTRGLVVPTKTVESSIVDASPSSSHIQVSPRLSTPTTGNTISARSEDDIDPVILIVIPIMAVLFLLAVILAFVLYTRSRRNQNRYKPDRVESCNTELSRKGLVESLENVNNNTRTTGFANKGSDDKSSRSMSRTSSISNLETIHEDDEPEEPEVYDL